MLQQEVDRLIDFVINNNIKTKTIKGLGKARFKKTTLETLEERDSRVAAEEAARKLAIANANKNKIPPVPNDPLPPIPSPDLPLPPIPVDETEYPEYDAVDHADNNPEFVKEEVEEGDINDLPSYSRDTYPDDSIYGIMQRYYPQDVERQKFVSKIGRNLVMPKKIFDDFYKYAKDRTDRYDVQGCLAYIFRHYDYELGEVETAKAIFVHNGQGPRATLSLPNAANHHFVLAGYLDDNEVYFVVNKEGQPKKFKEPWSSTKPVNTKYKLNATTWTAKNLVGLRRADLQGVEQQIWDDTSMHDFLKKYQNSQLRPVPYLRVVNDEITSSSVADSYEEPVSLLEEVLDDADDQKGGWIWLLA